MAIARITGQMLNSNLDRSGTDLAIDGNLIYAAVTTRNVGIRTISPQYPLDVRGNAHLGNLYILGNTITTDYGNIIIGSITQVSNVTQSNNTTSGALQVTGGVGIQGNLNVGGDTNISGNLSIDNNFSLTGNLTIDYLLAGKINSGTVTIPASANQIYVAKNGNDSNDGTINSPFLTIAAAVNSITSSQPSRGGLAIHVAPGLYTENNPITLPNNVSLIGDTLRGVAITPANPNSDIFYLSGGTWVWGLTVQNYNANAFAYSSAMSNMNFYTSPYIQNVTSISSSPTACAVMIDGSHVGSGGTKAMIVGFYTIINQGGYGVRLMNNAYAQLVNIYTIATNVGVWSDSGSFCTLNGSDNSIGNVGLQATGYGPLATSGNTVGYSIDGVFTITNMATQPHVNQVAIINGDANFYSINTITQIDAITYQITVPETYTANLVPGTNISFYQRSEVVASAHTFEYVGAGTNMVTALPQFGGLPNANLNVITSNGGRVTYTATDEKGNFWIGSNLVINQGTGTISGDSFNRSLFAVITPYILALETALG